MLGKTQQLDLPTLDPGITLREGDDQTTEALHLLQTTLAYWQCVLTAHHPVLAPTPTQGVTVHRSSSPNVSRDGAGNGGAVNRLSPSTPPRRPSSVRPIVRTRPLVRRHRWHTEPPNSRGCRPHVDRAVAGAPARRS